jgi:hypothetical protein
MEQEIREAAPLGLREMLDIVRDPRISKDATGYGQVAQLKAGARPELRTLWVAPTGSITAPFLPYRIGVESVPPEYGKHRYLTKNQSRGFVTEDWQVREATLFAGRLFKRLMYYTCDRPDKFLPEVTEALTAFENRMLVEQSVVDETAEILFAAKKPALARTYLTNYVHGKAAEALDLGTALLASIEVRTRVLYGLREPETDELSRLDYQMVTCRMPAE